MDCLSLCSFPILSKPALSDLISQIPERAEHRISSNIPCYTCDGMLLEFNLAVRGREKFIG